MADVTVRVRQTVEGSQNVRGFGQRLESTLQTIQRAGVAAAAAGATFKKAFDLAEEGANIAQVEASFNRLNETVFQTPDLLEDMREASNRTIRDTELMSAALTLTAGTTGEMSQALARATPQLVSMAKAANAINPELGDTTFLLDSLSVAAKRQSRLLADNAGIVVKLDDAVQQVHPSLRGLADTYEELPENLRFLNEMLHQGNNLLEQAGGAAQSAVDPYQRLRVEVRGLGDAFKGVLDTGLRPWARAISGINSEQVEPLIQNQIRLADSLEDYIEVGQRIESQHGLMSVITGTNRALARGAEDVARNLARLSDDADEFRMAMDEAFSFGEQRMLFRRFEDVEDVSDLFRELTREAQANAAAIEESRRTYQEHSQAVQQAAEVSRDFAEADRLIAQGEAEIREQALATAEAYERRREALGQPIELQVDDSAMEEATEQARQIADLFDRIEGRVWHAKIRAQLAGEGGRGVEDFDRVLEEKLTGVFRGKEIEGPAISTTSVDRLQEKLGLADEAAVGVQRTVSFVDDTPVRQLHTTTGEAQTALDTLQDGSPYESEVDHNLDQATIWARKLKVAIDNVPTSKTVRINTVTTGGIPAQGGGPGFQRGADFIVPPGFQNDSFPFRASSGERVQVTPAGQGGGGSNWYGDLHVHGGNPDDVVRVLMDRGIIPRTALR